MQFINSIWLWGLTGLLIPIGIHLLSRKEGKVIRVGSLRHLEETSTRQFRNIRLNELLLLALRCLLITLVVLMLSGIHINTIGSTETKYLLLEKGMEHESGFTPLIDSLDKNGFETRWLFRGFPLLKDSATIQSKPNYWILIESLKKEKVEQVVVLSFNYVTGFKGKRTEMPANVKWISKNPDPSEFILTVAQLSRDSVLVRKGNTNAEATRFSNSNIRTESLSVQEKVLLQNPDTVSISIYNDAKFQTDAEIVLAALKAVDEASPCIMNIKSSNPSKWNNDKSEWTIWLSEKPLPENSQTNSIRYLLNEITNELLIPSDKGWLITQRLDRENAIANNFTLQLASILIPNQDTQTRADVHDRRALPEKQMWSTSFVQRKNDSIPADASKTIPYLFGFVLIVLLTERIVAFKRNQ